MSEKIYDIAIIGAGAAGIVAALSAKEYGVTPVLIEGSERIGQKILSTGNGKCNLSHDNIDADSYYGSGSLRVLDYLKQFGTSDTIDFYGKLGMLTRNRDGYYYPYSEQASTVLDVLRFSLDKAGIPIISNCKISKIIKASHGYTFSSADTSFKARKLIITTGGCSAPKTGSDGSGMSVLSRLGVNVVKCMPALVKVKSSASFCKAVDGVRAKGIARLRIDGADTEYSDQGEIQFTKDGLSGIPIFNLSRYIAYSLDQNKTVNVRLDLMPEYTEQELFKIINDKYEYLNYSCTPEILFTGLVNKKIILALLKLIGVKPEEKQELTTKQVSKFCYYLKNLEYDITDVYGFEQSQVTAGGVDFAEVNDTLEILKYPGIYLAGEILDIDGKCGGYNLQWAWTSGYLAGKYCAEALTNETSC